LPSLIEYFERVCRTQELNDYLPEPIDTETLMFVTSHQAVMPISRNCYQPFETYGDSVIKAAVSIWLWKKGKHEGEKKLEGFVTENRMPLITNHYLSLLAEFNGFSRWMHLNTPDAGDFHFPFLPSSPQPLKCSGKMLADFLEAMAGAILLEYGFKKACRWLHEVRLLPLKVEDTLIPWEEDLIELPYDVSYTQLYGKIV
jgi:dsRNA-specific ribonuclease